MLCNKNCSCVFWERAAKSTVLAGISYWIVTEQSHHGLSAHGLAIGALLIQQHPCRSSSLSIYSTHMSHFLNLLWCPCLSCLWLMLVLPYDLKFWAIAYILFCYEWVPQVYNPSFCIIYCDWHSCLLNEPQAQLHVIIAKGDTFVLHMQQRAAPAAHPGAGLEVYIYSIFLLSRMWGQPPVWVKGLITWP